MKLFLTLLLLFSASLCLPARGQERYVTGMVRSDSGQLAIPTARITNLRNRNVTRSNTTGTFMIMARPGDWLEITCPTCDPQRVRIDSTDRDVEVAVARYVVPQGTTLLQEVTVRGKSDAEMQEAIRQIQKEPEAQRRLTTDQALGMAESPISLLYELFSKRAASLRKLAVLQQQDRRRELADYRFNKPYVQDITGLPDGPRLDDFYAYCRPSDEFILRATDYALMNHVRTAWRDYGLGKPRRVIF